ncbi:energy-coupling factor transporter transmembrane component T family protein [Alicyclobacillus dauci]|uniref:Energy-coupling factor transporter transmembrane protein EcfT n=1 Tax=Alicyclobacillus dauci TaxID=1475485 RepID=A0ABY6YZD6_9BACL|nr:energy-coupling factor transporter transmembrane component T [Alicyclobacillus dauci]WAH35875.1 energy-coupling factor transporter transmembrane protein EcfT [Alicyclobacillus dauci]
MANFEVSKYITIGRYIPRDSFIHRMDPRVKLFCFVLWILAVSLLPSVIVQLGLLVLTVCLFAMAKLPMGYGMSGIRPVLPIVIIVLLFEVIFARSGPNATVLIHAGWLKITTTGILLAVISAARFFTIVWLVSLLTLTTSLSNLTHALERLMSPLQAIRVPVRDMVMMFTIALRFVPLLAEEAERIMKAQAARGADFGTAPWWRIDKRTRSVFPILVPLFIGALQRGETLVLAMEVRGYRPGEARSSYVSFSGRRTDVVALLLSIVVIAIAAVATWGWKLV